MKPYLISKEVLGRQVYRYDPAYRFAAFLFLSLLLAQVPAVIWFAYEREVGEERHARGAQLATDASRIADERKAQADTERKLKRIQDLGPLLRARLPLSAVLGKIELLAPPDLAVSRVTIDVAAFQPVQIETSLFRIPRQLRIVIEGEQPLQAGKADSYSKLAEQLLQSLPPESKIAERNLIGGSRFRTFRLTFLVPTNGNYFGLGATKIATLNSL